MKSTSEIYKRLVTNASSVSSKTSIRCFYNGSWFIQVVGRSSPTITLHETRQNSLFISESISGTDFSSWTAKPPPAKHGLHQILALAAGHLGITGLPPTLFLQLYYFLFPIPPCHPTR